MDMDNTDAGPETAAVREDLELANRIDAGSLAGAYLANVGNILDPEVRTYLHQLVLDGISAVEERMTSRGGAGV